MTLASLRRRSVSADCGQPLPVDKFEVLRAVTQCKSVLGFTDRTVTVLSALLSCLPVRVLSLDERLTAYPSNKTLCERANGMPEATLRRHLDKLIGAGLIVRHDSPNGKRYARGRGPVRVEFGFDLSPIVFRAPSIFGLVAERRERREEQDALYQLFKVRRRDLLALLDVIEAAQSSQIVVDLRAKFSRTVASVTKRTALTDLRAGMEQLVAIESEAIHLLPHDRFDIEMSGDERQFERHIQDSKLSNLLNEDKEVDLEAEELERVNALPGPQPIPFTVDSVLIACPGLRDYSRTPITNWGQFFQAASHVRTLMQIKRDTWEEALDALGIEVASIVVAAIHERHSMLEVKTPGAYLRCLTKKALQGKFSPKPMLVSLMREQLRTGRLQANSMRLGVSPAALQRLTGALPVLQAGHSPPSGEPGTLG